ncbi:MAG: DEAD/DEAH box helicase family protein, partial [Aquificaceae bacterium]|nr:DEAD/DEAH box helicase family protein [Aquificaceae bacterium]
FVAFQIVWKLLNSGYFSKLGRPGRVLFLADRVVLRNQAYNAFSPFSGKDGEPRYLIEGHPPKLNRQLYFGIYQTLWAEDQNRTRLYQKFPRDFFDLVIIDECHRSGWGTWREILEHFGGAIHLGMTATPKRDDNVDTYAYFGEPVYEYSLSQGIEDGFLATYRVHRVLTTVDQQGLTLQDAVEQGAEVFVPEEVEPRSVYTTPQFEREITLPDRTKQMVKHLASLLRKYGPKDKTMVFCVDMEHARQVARLLQNELGAELGIDNYAVPILSEEGERARQWLESFVDSDKETPVVAVTAELLSTGVDVPSCKNIVFMKTVSSTVLFKQIIGRGSRIDKATEKYWFRIIDYTGATRLFDKWDLPQKERPPRSAGPFTASLKGKVIHALTGVPIQGAKVSVQTAPNSQQGPILTDEEGVFEFRALPEGRLRLVVSAPGFLKKELSVDTQADKQTQVEVPLKPETKERKKIRVEGISVEIAEEKIFILESTGQSLTLEQYKAYIGGKVRQKVSTLEKLRNIWIDNAKRREFMQYLRSQDAEPTALSEVEDLSHIDTFDLLAHLSFKSPLRSREERYKAFMNREGRFLKSFKPAPRTKTHSPKT